MPMAWRISTAAGGVLVMNVKERSSKTVISTGIVVPMSFAVWALNALTNSMMLMPCWPSAGPTGGAGEAWPPGACSLMVVRTFLAIFKVGCSGRGGGDVSPSNLLHLVVPHFDRSLAAEDGYQHLELGRVLVDLGDLTGEVRERAGDHLHGFADRELSPARDLVRHLAVQQPVDLGLGQRDRLVGRADEARDARRALDDLPGVLVEVHVDQHVAGHGPLLHRDLLVVLHLLHRLRGDDDLPDRTGLVQRGHAVLEVLLDLVLVPGIGVDDVPAKHGEPLQNLLNDGVPDGVEEPEVGAGDEHEPQHHCGALADLAAIRPLDAAQLGPRGPQEVSGAAEQPLARVRRVTLVMLVGLFGVVGPPAGGNPRLRPGLGAARLRHVG